MEKKYTSCNFLVPDVMEASVPFYSLFGRTKKEILGLKANLFSLLNEMIYPQKTIKTKTSSTVAPPSESPPLNLQPGEWVQVRSIDEISVTLDEKGKYKGLYFMPEMEEFCGKNFKVFKRAEIIKLESTGEVRKLKSPSLFLEGVYCNGKRHEGCDRACFHFWREAWLKKIDDK